MVQKPLLEKGGTDQIEFIFRHPDDGRLNFNPAPPVQHMGKADSAIRFRQPVRCKPVQKLVGIRAFDKHLGKGGDIHNPD